MIFIGYFTKLYAADLPTRAVCVYHYLHDRAGKDGMCYPSIPTIARDLKLSRSTVKRALTDLEKGGWLTREVRLRPNGGQSSNLYLLRDAKKAVIVTPRG